MSRRNVDWRRAEREEAQRAAIARLPIRVQVEDGAQAAAVNGLVGVEVHREAGAVACRRMLPSMVIVRNVMASAGS